MENKIFNFLRPSLPEEEHPLDRAINFWIERNVNYKKLLLEGSLVPTFIMIAKLCVRDKAFQEEYAEDYVDGWVLFAKGVSRGDSDLIDKAEGLMKPMRDKIINYLASDSFRKYVLGLHVTGEEKLPISIPEIFITINELLLFLRREKSIVITKGQVDELKQKFVLDKITSWGLDGEFGKKMKELESFLYPDIFNPKGYLAFQYLMNGQKTKGWGIQSDIAYFYHKLKGEELVHAKKEKFNAWFAKAYPEFPTIDRLHDPDRISETNSRKERLAQALDFIGLKK